MPKTILNEFLYPDENQDPFYKTISSFFDLQDVAIWNSKLRSNFILAGGGTLTWNPSGDLFSWTSDFAIKHLISGFLIEFEFGPDGANREATVIDGQIIYATFASLVTANQKLNLSVSDKISKSDSNFVLGWRYGNGLYLQNGIIL